MVQVTKTYTLDLEAEEMQLIYEALALYVDDCGNDVCERQAQALLDTMEPLI